METPPNNTDAEKALLGSVLIRNSGMEELTIQPDDFYKESHKKIFSAMKYLTEKETPVDITTLTTRLKGMRSLEKSGGHAYVASLANHALTGTNIKHYEKLVLECSLRRKLISSAYEIELNALDEKQEIEEVLEKADKEITNIVSDNSEKLGDDKLVDMNDILTDYENFYASKEEEGMSLGLESLDNENLRLPNGEVMFIYAPTGGKKSMFCLNIAYSLAKSGKKILYVNLEMQPRDIIGRLVCMASGLDSYRIKRREFEDGEITMALGKLSDINLQIHSPATMSIAQLKRTARAYKKKHGLDLIVVDHLHLISSKFTEEIQRVSEAAEGLKIIARELNIPVIAPLQISRYAQMNGKKPEKTDARGSSVIENTAGLILSLYKDIDKKLILTPDENEIDIYVLKNRYGIEGQVIPVKFNFRNLKIY